MHVPVTDFRANLREWLSRARNGEEIVVTERGTPIVRVVGVQAATTLERLTAEGVIGRPDAAERPRARERPRVRARRPVSPRIGEQRR